MMVFIYIAIVILLLYAFNVLRLAFAANRCSEPDLPEYKTAVTVLIPARNEAKCIDLCIKALCQQNYPKQYLELIVIDDHSEDDTVNRASEVFLKSDVPGIVISLKESTFAGKKAAIEQGVLKAKGELIVCTDADSIALNNDWIKHYVNCYETRKSALIAAPVIFKRQRGFLFLFQQMEIMGLNLISAGAIAIKRPLMCNGANMAFSKKAFMEVNGYEGNRNIASGDDVFLLNKITANFPHHIDYLYSKESLVLTEPKTNFTEFMHQRMRWSGKIKSNSNWFNLYVAFITFLSSLVLFLCFAAWFFYPAMFWYFTSLILFKCFIDFLLLFLAALFFEQKRVVILFPLAVVFNVLYVCFTGITGLFIRPVWKGRKI